MLTTASVFHPGTKFLDWYLRFYPNGDSRSKPNHAAAFLFMGGNLVRLLS
jgi:hypothetical protein